MVFGKTIEYSTFVSKLSWATLRSKVVMMMLSHVSGHLQGEIDEMFVQVLCSARQIIPDTLQIGYFCELSM